VPRRVTPSQLRSQLRRAEQKQRQAINKYNAAVRRFNSESKKATDKYNREVRAHNARVRSNRQRLQREIHRLRSPSSTTRYVTYRQSVTTLRTSFERIEASVDVGTWNGDEQLFDLSEGETANSVAVLNALLEEPESAATRDGLQTTAITGELAEISPDLEARWQGALYALHPSNPDAARHFCTSSREILSAILESEAPDDAVLDARPDVERTNDGRITRRARVRFCLEKSGVFDEEFVQFVEDDIDNIVALFREFNDGTHGSAGRFTLSQLAAIKKRVEDAILFLNRIVRPT
jgi:hypothetical protein